MATATMAAPIDDARFKAMAWLITHQNGDGSWPGAPGLEMAETAAAVEALVNAGMTQSDTFTNGVAWLQNHEAYSTDALSRQIIALAKSGRDTSDLVTRLIDWRNNEASPKSSWGAYDHYGTSYPDTAMALEAIKVAAASYAEEGYSVCNIVAQRNTAVADGGWPYFVPPTGTQPSGILPTAYSLIVLSRYKTSSCGTTTISSVLTSAASWLTNQQKTPGGGFGEGSAGTVMETALAYRALTAVLGASDPAVVNAQNFLIAQQQGDGSWGNGDALLTTLTLAAMPTVALADIDRDGLPDGTETQALLGTNPNLPDAFGLLRGNGRGIAGETTALPLTKAFIDLPYTASLATSNGTPPYSWLLSSGYLPDGLSLDSNTGEITGTPTALGVYNFSYEILAADMQTSIVSQIEVTEPQPTQVPALPAWAMLLMGGLLSVIMRHAEHRKTRTIR